MQLVTKLYWLVVAGLPFLPWLMLNSLQERLACAYGSACFVHGLPFQVEGSLAGILTGIVLWPMCLWQLGGRSLWVRFVREPQNGA